MPKRFRLFWCFYTFRGDSEVESFAQRNDCVHDCRGLWINFHLSDEGPIDLDLVEGKLPEIRQTRISCTKIIQRDRDSSRPKPCQLIEHSVGILEPETLGHFKFEPFRIESRELEHFIDDFHNIPLAKLKWRKIDCYLQRFCPGCSRTARCLQYPGADGNDETCLFGDRDKLSRRLRLPAFRPTQQRLKTNKLAPFEFDERLVSQMKCLGIHCAAQICFQPATLAEHRVHSSLEKRRIAPALTLCPMKSDVRAGEQPVPILRVGR